MKNKILKIAFAFILFSVLFVTASFATEIKEDVANYNSDVFIIGSTRFDGNQVITATMAANAGVNEAKVNLFLYGNIDDLKVTTYYYSELFGEWNEVKENGEVKLLTDSEVKKLEDNLNIFFVNNEEKVLEIPYEGTVDENSIWSPYDNVTFENNKFQVPVLTMWFSFNSNGVSNDVLTNVNTSVLNEENILENVEIIPNWAAIKVGEEYFTEDQIKEAIEKSSPENEAKLLKYLELDSSIVLEAENMNAVLNLNYYTLTAAETNTDKYIIELKAPNSTLTVKNGWIEGATGGIKVDTSNLNNSTATLNVSEDAYVSGAWYGVLVLGKGATTNVEGTVVARDPEAYAISGNGSAGYEGTEINVLGNAEVRAEQGVAIYLPQTGVTNISENAYVVGKTAVAMKSGTLNVNGGTLIAEGEKIQVPEETGNGTKPTGDTIYVELNKNYAGNVKINIADEAYLYTSNGSIVRVYKANPDGKVTITGRSLTAHVNNNVIAYDEEDAVIAVGETNYAADSLDYALDLLVNGSETKATLLMDIELTKALEINKELEIDLNGHTIDSTNVPVDPNNYKMSYAFKVTEGGNLSIKNGSMTTTKDTSALVMNILNLEGTLNADNVKFVGYYNIYTNYRENDAYGTTNITNCTLDSYFAGLVGWNYAIVNVSNSTISGHWYAIAGNGSCKDTDFNITNCTLTSEAGAAIFMPSTKTLNITGSTLTGLSGIEGAAGTINITDTDITATGAYKETFADDTKTGCWVEGSAIFVRVQGGYADNTAMTLKIDDKSTLTSDNGNGIRVYEASTSTAEKGIDSVDIEYYSNTITATNGEKTLVESKTEKPVTATDKYVAE